MTRKSIVPAAPEAVSQAATRRSFLKAATGAAAAGATLGFPMIAKGQAGPIAMRWQSTWPSKDIFHEYALDYAKKVNDMTGGDLKIEVLPAGAVVPRSGCSTPCRRERSTAATACSSTTTASRMRWRCGAPARRTAWTPTCCSPGTSNGGGKELLTKLSTSIGANVVSFPYGPMPTQPLGWFKKPITKTRTSRASSSAPWASPSTCSPASAPRSTRCPAARSSRDGPRPAGRGEFNNASSDRLLGFADVSKVCMLQSYHQNAEQFEITFNKTKYDALPEKMRAIIA